MSRRETKWLRALLCAGLVLLGCGCSKAPDANGSAPSGAGTGVASNAATTGGMGAQPMMAGTNAPSAGGAGRTGDIAGSSGMAGTNGIAGGTSGSGGMTGIAGSTAGAGGTSDSAAMRCTGKPGMVRGKSRQMVTVGGLQRWFNYYAPSALDSNSPVALVLVPHGFYMDADIMYEVTKYADLADQEQFVVAFPSGAGATPIEPPWNIGKPDPQCIATVGFLPMTQNDDQAFLDAIIAFAEADQCLDKNHVFMTGFSMGAYFSNTTGCNREQIKAIAPHSGGSHDFANCPVQTKPVLLLHFDSDALIPYVCGTETRDRWLTLNGCQAADPEIRMVTGGRCEYYKGCPAHGQVAMCTFQAPATGDELFVGHGWSGGFEPQPVVLSGYAIPETESATRLSWQFFKEFAW